MLCCFFLLDALIPTRNLICSSPSMMFLFFTFKKIPFFLCFSLPVTANNFQTCLGLLMHYPPVEDINALLQKALFLRDPKVSNHPPLSKRLNGRVRNFTTTNLSWIDSFAVSDFASANIYSVKCHSSV